jgi:hypothetical protein
MKHGLYWNISKDNGLAGSAPLDTRVIPCFKEAAARPLQSRGQKGIYSLISTCSGN